MVIFAFTFLLHLGRPQLATGEALSTESEVTLSFKVGRHQTLSPSIAHRLDVLNLRAGEGTEVGVTFEIREEHVAEVVEGRIEDDVLLVVLIKKSIAIMVEEQLRGAVSKQ